MQFNYEEKINIRFMLFSMFEGCSSLKSLPDISKFHTNKAVSLTSMFEGCSSLKTLPDISMWDTSNVSYMKKMFKGCSSLESLPDISKWDIVSLKDKETFGMFEGCAESLNIPEKFKNNK